MSIVLKFYEIFTLELYESFIVTKNQIESLTSSTDGPSKHTQQSLPKKFF